MKLNWWECLHNYKKLSIIQYPLVFETSCDSACSNSSTWEKNRWILRQGHPQIPKKFEARLGCMIPGPHKTFKRRGDFNGISCFINKFSGSAVNEFFIDPSKLRIYFIVSRENEGMCIQPHDIPKRKKLHKQVIQVEKTI